MGCLPAPRCRRPSVPLGYRDVAAARCELHGRQGALWPRGCLPTVPPLPPHPCETYPSGAQPPWLCAGHPSHPRADSVISERSRRSLAQSGPAGALPPIWRPQFAHPRGAPPGPWEQLLPSRPSGFWFVFLGSLGPGNWMYLLYAGPFTCLIRVSNFSFLPAVGLPLSGSFFLACCEEHGFDFGFLLFRGDAVLCPGASGLLPPDPLPGPPHRHL